QLLENLKERDDTFDIPMVVCTEDADAERAFRMGAHSFLSRPLDRKELMEAVLSAERESRRERILIIDDQPDALRLLAYLLDEHGDFRVFTAQSGDEGIMMVARRRPDLVILDLRMPGKDGFAVLDELRGNPETANIPVLVVTGDVDLSASEQESLANIRIVPKTDISREEYARFIDNVRAYLESDEDSQ
ncbi:MAG: response regulator, partial [Anaerolineae bacterium]|nr:response regulator [Anaerolineae bacterium]